MTAVQGDIWTIRFALGDEKALYPG